MHQKLVKQAFEEIKKIEEKKLGVIISDTQASELLSITLKEDYKTPLSDRTLRDIFNGLIDIKKSKVVVSLCKFLNYKSYEEFKTKNSILPNLPEIKKPTEPTLNLIEKTQTFIQRNKVSIMIPFILLFTGIAFYASTKQRWMVWNENHYEEVSFNTKKYSLEQLKLYKEDRIKYFKKIEGTCEYPFFNKAGKPTIWYGRNRSGDLELFTSVGLHPETGKTLKHITPYMIKKYICK